MKKFYNLRAWCIFKCRIRKIPPGATQIEIWPDLTESVVVLGHQNNRLVNCPPYTAENIASESWARNYNASLKLRKT